MGSVEVVYDGRSEMRLRGCFNLISVGSWVLNEVIDMGVGVIIKLLRFMFVVYYLYSIPSKISVFCCRTVLYVKFYLSVCFFLFIFLFHWLGLTGGKVKSWQLPCKRLPIVRCNFEPRFEVRNIVREIIYFILFS